MASPQSIAAATSRAPGLNGQRAADGYQFLDAVSEQRAAALGQQLAVEIIEGVKNVAAKHGIE